MVSHLPTYHVTSLNPKFPQQQDVTASLLDHWDRYLTLDHYPKVAQSGIVMVQRSRLVKKLIPVNTIRKCGSDFGWKLPILQEFTRQDSECLSELLKTAEWDFFTMNQRSEKPSAHLMLECLNHDLKPIILPNFACMSVDFPYGWDAYLQSKSKKTVRVLKNRFRKAEDLKPKLVVYDSTASVEEFMSNYLPHHLDYWNSRGICTDLHNPTYRNMMQAWFESLQKTGQLHLSHLELDNKPVNYAACIIDGSDLLGVLTINTGEYQDYVPGFLSMYLRIQQISSELGLTSYNLGMDMDYKRQLANRRDAVWTVCAANPKSIKGQLYFKAKSLRGRLTHASQLNI